MKKIIVIADSSALPNHLVRYENTWIYKLKKSGSFDVITYAKRGLNSNVLCESGGDGIVSPFGSDCLEFFMPDTAIVQLGIVDCSPRLIKKRSIHSKIVATLPKNLRKYYLLLLKKIRKRTVHRVDVSLENFQENIESYVNRALSLEVNRIIFIGIALPDEEFINKNPNVVINVRRYNEVLVNIVRKDHRLNYIDPLNSDLYDHKIFTDGYHPNEQGHGYIWNLLEQELNSEIL